MTKDEPLAHKASSSETNDPLALFEQAIAVSERLLAVSHLEDVDQIIELIAQREQILARLGNVPKEAVPESLRPEIKQKIHTLQNLQVALDQRLNKVKDSFDKQLRGIQDSRQVLAGYRVDFGENTTMSSQG